MAELSLDEAIPRFQANENRIDTFANGGPTESFTTSNGEAVPSLRKFLSDRNAEIISAGSKLPKDGSQPMSGKLGLAPSTASVASLNLPVGTFPAAPVDGDIGRGAAGTGIQVRDNGVTQTLVTGTALSSAINWLPDHPPVDGEAARNTNNIFEIFKGEIRLEWDSRLTWGIGVTAAQRQTNTRVLRKALIASSTLLRPLRGKRGATLEIDSIDPGLIHDAEFDGNWMVLRSGGTAANTMLYIHGTDSAIRLRNFKLYNIILDGYAQAKDEAFYILSLTNTSELRLENIILRDYWATGLYLQDAYPNSAGYPAMTSNDAVVRNIRHERTTANLAAIASKPLMMQGDQFPVVGHSNIRLENIACFWSGRSGLSFGLCQGSVLRGFKADSCWVGLYSETLRNCIIDNWQIVNYMGHDGSDVASSPAGAGLWQTDGDQTASGHGLPTCQNLIISNGLISSVVRQATGEYMGVRISGRNGNYPAEQVLMHDVIVQGVASANGQGKAFCLEGQIKNSLFRGLVARNVDSAAVLNVSYKASGGVPVNALTNTWIDGMAVQDCGYAVYAPGSDTTHTLSGVRNSNFGGAGVAFGTTSLINHSSNTN